MRSQLRILVTGHQGYIGSALMPRLAACGHHGCGIGRPDNYQTLSSEWLCSFDVIVHLAAHSSVQKCEADPTGAIANNVGGFHALLDRLHSHQRIIYASTGTVHHGGGSACNEADRVECKTMLYDVTKFAMEGIAATHSHPSAIGLRFGSVCGLAPHMRWEILLNNMARSAARDGQVTISNANCFRSVLGIEDCLRALIACCEFGGVVKDVFNVASFTATIGDIGGRAASSFHVPLQSTGNTPKCYDFGLDTNKFARFFRFGFRESCESICDSFKVLHSCEN